MRNRVQNQKRKVAVCLVERNPLAARYLLGLFDGDPNIEILSEDSVLNAPTNDNRIPIFVIDAGAFSGPLGNYLTVLRSHFADARTLILGKEPSTDELRRLLFLGIQGFVSYDEVKDRLCAALRAISEGETWFAPEALREFMHDSGRLLRAGTATGEEDMFTSREKRVLGLVRRRLGDKEIAEALHISESTVRFHLSNIFSKLGVHDRHSAAELATARRAARKTTHG